MKRAFLLLIGLVLVILPGSAQGMLAFDPYPQTASLFWDENQTVYLTNLERRKEGLMPLRWNRELTVSARWFSWDSVENRPNGYCGHTDTLGGGPWDRAATWGYQAFTNAENAFCGYVTPQYAVDGWMASPGHHDNILNTTSNEIGLGYYRRASDGRGYVAQPFGFDGAAPSVIIENEKPSTTTTNVNLYLQSFPGSSGFMSFGPAVEMRISNEPCFTGASWSGYQVEKAWTLPSGSGWKTVHAQTRDAAGRVSNSKDTIYLGDPIPKDGINLDHLSQTTSSVKVYNLNSGGRPLMQLSLGWMADDQNANFSVLSGSTVRDNDPAALGGTAVRFAQNAATWGWVWEYNEFPDNQEYVAYFRLKTSSNASSSSIFSVNVDPGGAGTGGELVIKGTDFQAAGQYQEFALPFRYASTEDDRFLIFGFSLHGDAATVWIDAVTIFSPSIPVPSNGEYTWTVPGGHYRGQGVWVRYLDAGGQSTSFYNAVLMPVLHASTEPRTFLLEPGQQSARQWINVQACGSWTASSTDWLKTSQSGNRLEIWADATGKKAGTYQQTLIVQSGDTTINIPVTMIVVQELKHQFLPAVNR